MIPDTFSLRRVAVAYIFQAQPELRREDNLQFYDKVTSQGLELPQFNQERTSVSLIRAGGGGRQNSFRVEAGQHQGQFRFLVVAEWPTRPLKLVAQDADIAWEAFREVWPPGRIGQRPALIEGSVRASAAAKGGDATKFLADECFRVPRAALAELGRDPNGIGMTLMLPVEVSTDPSKPSIPLESAGGRVKIETLLDDPSQLYFDLNVKWPSGPVPPEIRQAAEDVPDFVNPDVYGPGEYLRQSYDYLTGEIAGFLTTAASQ